MSHSQSPEPFGRSRLFAASFLALFLELSLIRFLPAYVRAVGYYTNLVLIASFLGLGIGFILASRRVRLDTFIIPAILVTLAANYVFMGLNVYHAGVDVEPLWFLGPEGDVRIEGVVLATFILVASTLIPVGQVMGRLFACYPRLQAYGLDLGGSLCGVVVFGVLSALETPPLLWFTLSCAVVMVVVLRGAVPRIVGGTCSVAVLALVWIVGQGQIWSPYYMVEVGEASAGKQPISVNGALHQVILDFESSDAYVRKTRERFLRPYQSVSKLDNVLIVGSGSGNDVAIAQLMGARRIDAVEIDRVFARLGMELHPQRPYQGEGVTLHIADARTFLQQSEQKYDLIVFGTLDSQTLLGGLSSIRLDNYMYTEEAFAQAYLLLEPGGRLVVFHYSVHPYIAERIFHLLTETAGRKPLGVRYTDPTLFNYVFIQGEGLPQSPAPAGDLKIPTDDWPFLYLKEPGLPWHYAWVLLGMLLVTLVATGAAFGKRWRGFDLGLFLLGAGFLLLETSSVTRLSLLFGSTWTVNLLVFSSILAILLLANLVVLKWDLGREGVRIGPMFWLLAALLVGLTFLPMGEVSALPRVLQLVIGGLNVALPVGLAGLIFPVLFARARDTQAAFASNLLGAILGGACEYSAMMFGIVSLNLIAVGCYLAALAAFRWSQA